MGTQLIKFKQQSDSENTRDYVGGGGWGGQQRKMHYWIQQSSQIQKSQFYGFSGFPRVYVA